MIKVEVRLDLEIPEGFEWTGEIRCPKEGECYLANWAKTASVRVVKAEFEFVTEKYPILRKAEVWKKLTPEKVLEHMKSRKPITLRHTLRIKKDETATVTIDALYANPYGTLYFKVFETSHVDLLEYLEESK